MQKLCASVCCPDKPRASQTSLPKHNKMIKHHCNFFSCQRFITKKLSICLSITGMTHLLTLLHDWPICLTYSGNDPSVDPVTGMTHLSTLLQEWPICWTCYRNDPFVYPVTGLTHLLTLLEERPISWPCYRNDPSIDPVTWMTLMLTLLLAWPIGAAT